MPPDRLLEDMLEGVDEVDAADGGMDLNNQESEGEYIRPEAENKTGLDRHFFFPLLRLPKYAAYRQL